MAAARGGSRPWRRTVARIIRRDGGICHLCGQPGADSADHVIPKSQGGSDHASNLRAVHHNVAPRCNRIRGDRPIEQTQALLTPTTNDWDW
jgi:5-methylcytosine-specific restriction endonuclease McrA